jgi:transcription elongation factor SPT4
MPVSENFVPPAQQRNLRACMVCSIVMTQNVLLPTPFPSLPPLQRLRLSAQRFLKEGCPNCDEFLHLQGSMDAIIDCTSQVFEGLITLADPSKSWVAKWQRLDSYVRGVYATKVSGVLPDEVVAVMEDEARIRYIPYVRSML